VRERAPWRSSLETAAQIAALLDAAAELDGRAGKERTHVERRAMIAALVFVGTTRRKLYAPLVEGWN
jgi:hypothetical protein